VRDVQDEVIENIGVNGVEQSRSQAVEQLPVASIGFAAHALVKVAVDPDPERAQTRERDGPIEPSARLEIRFVDEYVVSDGCQRCHCTAIATKQSTPGRSSRYIEATVRPTKEVEAFRTVFTVVAAIDLHPLRDEALGEVVLSQKDPRRRRNHSECGRQGCLARARCPIEHDDPPRDVRHIVFPHHRMMPALTHRAENASYSWGQRKGSSFVIADVGEGAVSRSHDAQRA
jgi:hypothetical protein